ncbi:hypothetical protein chiPu_0004399 [Chiloscyllium punctatum]|uniref:Uncharacterized protein n=1 Tax=Chiloscyllium punctatum TaxID=137246 RepID=A0A401S6G5_CHIPU|nr:hypothetical protein [Chiloscyllium punctatum]
MLATNRVSSVQRGALAFFAEQQIDGYAVKAEHEATSVTICVRLRERGRGRERKTDLLPSRSRNPTGKVASLPPDPVEETERGAG